VIFLEKEGIINIENDYDTVKELPHTKQTTKDLSMYNREEIIMKLFSGKKVGVSKEEKVLSYFKFYEWDMAKIPAEKLALLDAPQNKSAVPFEEKNLYLEGRDNDYAQVGYGTATNGTGFVCNETYMPDVTVEMLDWWFPWHSVGSDLRYKIWDPEDHYFARADKPDYVCNPNVPINEKTWGVNHYILEDVGGGPSFLKICFKSPAEFGFDTSLIGKKFCASLVCGIGDGPCAAAMTHKWFPYQDGVKLCSRFWIGYGIIDGKISCTLPDGAHVPVEVSKGLFAHNIKEFTNLAAILPEVYAENKDNF